MNMAFELPKRGSNPTSDGGQSRDLLPDWDEGSSGSGVVLALLLCVVCWMFIFGILWMWIG
jgi:hypothetical protein